MSMDEQKETFIAKFIRRPYDDYCFTSKEKLKAEKCVQIFYLRKPKDDNNIISHYANLIKGLILKCRTILFYDVPIRLSKQQFCVLYLLLIYGDISSLDYAELSEILTNKRMKRSAIDNNIKSFVSDFINTKLINTIKKYKNQSYFTGMSDEQIKQVVDKLIYYKKSVINYTIKTTFRFC